MEENDMLEWLMSTKHMGKRSAKDVISRKSRVLRMLDIHEIGNTTMSQLVLNKEFTQSTSSVKSQLKRAIILCLEFQNLAED